MIMNEELRIISGLSPPNIHFQQKLFVMFLSFVQTRDAFFSTILGALEQIQGAEVKTMPGRTPLPVLHRYLVEPRFNATMGGSDFLVGESARSMVHDETP